MYYDGFTLHSCGVAHEAFSSGSGGGDRNPPGGSWVRGGMWSRPELTRTGWSLWRSPCLYTGTTDDGGILQGTLLPVIMVPKLHIAQEPEKPNEDLAGAAGGADATSRWSTSSSNNVARHKEPHCPLWPSEYKTNVAHTSYKPGTMQEREFWEI